MSIIREVSLAKPHECAAIVECIRSIDSYSGHSPTDDGVLYYSSQKLIDTSEFIFGLIGEIGVRVKQIAEQLVDSKLEDSNLAIFKTVPGHTPEEHADSQNMDGTPKDGCSDFVISSVVYLNDDFIGGHLVFPKLNYSYQPVSGDCLIFPSTVSHSHYVDRVASGERIVLPLWFSAVA
jgi:hypothetical protein